MKRAWPAFVLVGACLSASNVEAKPYKGAEILTAATYRFGRIEVRMRTARGPGILSTFFTYKPGSEGAGSLWEEIDVEVFGKSNGTVWQSNLLTGNPRMGSEQNHNVGSSLADAYHTYTIEWTPGTIVWKFDGVETRRTNGGQVDQLTSQHNFHFNLWASDASGWAGAFESSMLPQYQYVNWIRYYRHEGGNFVLDWTDDFNTFDTARWSKADWTFDGNLVDFDPNNAVVRDGTLILCMTAEGQGGCSGAVPADGGGNLGGAGNGGTSGTGGGGGGGGGGAGVTGGMPSSGGTAGTPGTSGAAAIGGSAGSGGALGSGGVSATAGAAGAGSGGIATNGGAAGGGGAPSGGQGSGGASAVPGAQGTGGSMAPANPGSAPVGSTATPSAPGDSRACAVAGKGHSSQSSLWIAAAAALVLQARRLRKKPVKSSPPTTLR
jgi:hypothetical protein